MLSTLLALPRGVDLIPVTCPAPLPRPAGLAAGCAVPLVHQPVRDWGQAAAAVCGADLRTGGTDPERRAHPG